jgi:uncharacterized protein YutE (UPF0331/DUF86 family)
MRDDKLKQLEENLRVLSKIKTDYTLKDLTSDKVDEWGLRYGLFESIQIIIDIACSLVSEKNLGMPKSYTDCISILISNKYLERDLGERITQMVGLRNLIVHEYGIINISKLYDYLDHLQDIRDFAIAISKATNIK